MNQVERKKKQLFNANKPKICELAKKINKFFYKNLVNKMHKLIIKELKLNVNHHIKTCRITTFFESNNI